MESMLGKTGFGIDSWSSPGVKAVLERKLRDGDQGERRT
jgi:hypothetical protein